MDLCDKATTVEFTEMAIKAYLDDCISFWREQREENPVSGLETDMPFCYIDAYQSVRTSIFGEMLP